MHEILKATLLGILEGLTEFIPVSSTGHLILFGHILEFSGVKGDTFSVFIQLGAILAVVFIYPKKFFNLFNFHTPENPFSGLSGIKRVFVASVPALISGFLLYDIIKTKLFNSMTVALALITGGLVLIFIEKFVSQRKQSFQELSLKDCFLVGCFQCFALWPGMSRSGSTIAGAMLLGANKKLAAEFSFFLAVPVMFAAVGYDLLKSWKFLSFSDLSVFLTGFIVSFLVAFLAIKFFLRILEKYSLAPFGWYRVVLGVLMLSQWR